MTNLDLTKIAQKLDPWACQVAVATIAAILGHNEEWSSDEIEDVAGCVVDVLKNTGLPNPCDSTSVDFWRAAVDW